MKFLSTSLACIAFLLFTAELWAGGRFSQMTIDLSERADFTYTTNPKDNVIIFNFKNMNVDQLTKFDEYDESIVRRIVFKEGGSLGAEVRMYLKDKDIRAVISRFDEPQRVVIDLFDKNFKQEIDPVSGLPVAEKRGEDNQLSTTASQIHLEAGQSSSSSYDTGIDSMSSESESPNKRVLVQPIPVPESSSFGNLEDLTSVAEGRGPGWKKFPAYMYPLPTAAFEGRTNVHGWKKTTRNTQLSAGQLAANKAFRLFKLGHELQANEIYQKVLHAEPFVFDNDPLHRWAFAEIQLGRGNKLLASENYSALILKSPGSDLAKVAQLRKFDIRALNLQGKGQTNAFKKMVRQMQKLPLTTSEQKSLRAIRAAYWSASKPDSFLDSTELPEADLNSIQVLESNLEDVESQRTAFLAGSLILRKHISKNTPWTKASGEFANSYFYKYRSHEDHPFYQSLRAGLKQHLAGELTDEEAQADMGQTVKKYEELPKSLKSIRKTPDVAWNVANAYRGLSQFNKAVPLYEAAAANFSDPIQIFKATYWLLDSAAKSRLEAGTKKEKSRYRKVEKKADVSLYNQWVSLSKEGQAQVQSEFNATNEKAVKEGYAGKSVSTILLARLKGSFGSIGQPASSDKAEDWQNNAMGTVAKVHLLHNLAQRFRSLGMTKSWREALKLLKEIKPDSLASDAKARRLWSKQLLSLAEDLRRNEDFLEAGRLLMKAAQGDEELENREETFYKGGLLLFRSGRRQEAIEAFKAAGDYSLAKERLNQLLQ